MLIFLLLLALVVIKPYLNPQFPYTHDGENHLARFANYKLAFKEGQFPPRWAPNLLNHYGYPVFNYNYPLANILSLPFSVLKIHYELTFKILVYAFVLIGLLGVNQWLKSLNYSAKPRILGILVFAFTPYLTNALIFRGNIGEIMALGLFPWLCFFIETSSVKSSKPKPIFTLIQTGVWAMLFLSHNIIAVFGTPILIGYAVLKYRRHLLEHLNLLLSVSGGFLLSMWFWLPAIFEKSLIVLDQASLTNDYWQHFPTLRQLMFSPLGFGFSKIGSVDSLSFAIGPVLFFVFILSCFNQYKKTLPKKYLAFLLLCLTLIVLQLKISQPLWEIFPISHFMQFPWRLSLFLTVFSLPLVARIFSHSNHFVKICIIVLLASQILTALKVRPADYFHREIITYDVFADSTSTAHENMPKDFTFKYYTDNWQPTTQILEGEGLVTVGEWRGSRHAYLLRLATPATIVEPTANFTGWETRVSGKPATYVNNEIIGGRIAFQLPAGDYKVVTKFTQHTRARQIGNWLSAITGVCLLLLTALPYVVQLYKKYAHL